MQGLSAMLTPPPPPTSASSSSALFFCLTFFCWRAWKRHQRGRKEKEVLHTQTRCIILTATPQQLSIFDMCQERGEGEKKPST